MVNEKSKRLHNILLRSAPFILLLLFSMLQSLTAQRAGYDYEVYPSKPFRFNQLDLKLKVAPSERILEGVANYTVTSTLKGANQIRMNASQIEISAVTVNGEEGDYSIQNDTLVIGLDESEKHNQKYDIAVTYTSSPTFGLHWNGRSTVWTSTLPYSVSHWLPIHDHPRTRLNTSIAITHPDTLGAFATGEQVKSVAEDTASGFRTTTWNSGKPVSATDIHFGVGEFQSTNIRYGVKNIKLLTEGNSLDEEARTELLDTAYKFLQQMENRFDYEYPYSSLNIVFLEDHQWDSKPYGASVIYLYENGGDYLAQLRRGIIGQWIGVDKREVQWLDADAMMLYQTWLYSTGEHNAEKLSTYEDYPETGQFTLYEHFRSTQWNQWLAFHEKNEFPKFIQLLEYTFPLLLENEKSIWSWDDMSRFWYDKTGYKYFERFEVPEQESQDSVHYDVELEYRQSEDKLKLVFQARDSVIKELVDVNMDLMYGERTDSRNLSFSGSKDSLLVNVAANLRSANIYASKKYPNLVINEGKSFEFWLFQLRNHPDKEARKKAAINIRSFTDNADLQLALIDALEQEEHAAVKAEILRTLSATTRGATGTHEMYTDRLSGNPLEVRVAALEALRAYPNVERVIQRVQRYALVSENPEMRKTAVQTYRYLASPDEFQSVVKRIVSETDNFAYLIPTILDNLYSPPDTVTESGRQLAESLSQRFIDRDYPYSIRARGLESLIDHDTLSKNWSERIPELLKDPDPRIRYKVIPALDKLSNQQAKNILDSHIFEEYDLRVLGRMEAYMNGLRDAPGAGN